MRNHDIIRLEFQSISGMKLDFASASYVFPEEEESHYFIAPVSFKLDELSSATRLHVALPSVQMSDANRTMIKVLVDSAEVSRSQKRQLEHLLFEWTTVCTDSLGSTSNITSVSSQCFSLCITPVE